MFFDSWYGVWRVLTVGVLAYGWLVVLLRVSGKRTLAKLNAFDLVVTVALGSTLATIAISSEVALLEGLTAFSLLAAAQFVVAWSSVRWSAARRLVKAEAVVLLRDGVVLEHVVRRQRLTVSEICQAVRSSGVGALEDVGAVVLETDGTLSVIPRSAIGSGSAVPR